jgi:mono/diheme cytochrome c family protein
MSRTSILTALGLAISLSAFVGCGGGEGGENEQEVAGGDTAAQQEMARSAPSSATEADAMEQQQQQGGQLPKGVTQEMVTQGRQLFTGAGLCSVCHGNDATGMPGLGANLTDSEWLHNDGSYQGILETVMTGVSAEESSTGTAMPPKGGSGITDEQAKAVAAYVYSLSHRG